MQVPRICKKCGALYYVDIDDTIPLCHSCYIELFDKTKLKKK